MYMTGDGAVERLVSPHQVRQANNVYAGIQRAPFTADQVGGTGWEACAIDFGGSSANRIQFTSTGAPDAGYIGLMSLYDFCSYGIDHPDIIISGLLAYQDYERAAMQKMVIYKESDVFKNANLTFDNLKLKGATWWHDPFCRNYVAANEISSSDLNLDNIVMLNSRYMKFYIDSRGDFTMLQEKSPLEQLAFVRPIIWRGLPVFLNPRTCGRIFRYPIA
jgi:hypothetical protein